MKIIKDRLWSTMLKFRKGSKGASDKVWMKVDDKVSAPIFIQINNIVIQNEKL